jgi:hypothetical protein
VAKTKTVIPQNWTPSERCQELLAAADIPSGFWSGLISEFVLYWDERQEKRGGWDSTFLGHAKRQWERSAKPAASFVMPYQGARSSKVEAAYQLTQNNIAVLQEFINAD